MRARALSLRSIIARTRRAAALTSALDCVKGLPVSEVMMRDISPAQSRKRSAKVPIKAALSSHGIVRQLRCAWNAPQNLATIDTSSSVLTVATTVVPSAGLTTSNEAPKRTASAMRARSPHGTRAA